MQMKISLRRNLPFLFILITIFVLYSLFIFGFRNNTYNKRSSSQVVELHQKIDEISKSLSDNQSFLKKLRDQFESVISKEAENRKKPIQRPSLKNNIGNVAAPIEDLVPEMVVIPVIVFVYNRPSVTRCLDLLLKYRNIYSENFPIVVSQDGDHQETTRAVKGYGSQITHIRHPDEHIDVPFNHRKFTGYYKISTHYKWAISETFKRFPSSKTLIIVEDDLEIAPDFFSYFFATYSLLLHDQSLYCVSAWNDNGKVGLIEETATTTLYRSDFFPGLGWMLKKSTWEEMKPKWPASFWDDWFRLPAQRLNRACIRPEISRTKTFGRIGVSNGQFFDKHLKFIKLNDQDVDWRKINLSYLEKKNYDEKFVKRIYDLPVETILSLQSNAMLKNREVRLEYESDPTFVSYAKRLGIMDDLKSGVPRMAYQGIVSFTFRGSRIHLSPSRPWHGYRENS